MKHFTITDLLGILGLFNCFGQAAKHVVIISIDGFRPEFYKDPSWPAPNLRKLAGSGVYADGVRGVFPSVTYPSHTTIITGAMPAKHGIYYNSPFEPEGQTGRWYWEESLIKTETLWDAVHQAGLKSASVAWPVSAGAPIDYNIPEVWSLDKNVDRLAPIRQQATPAGLFEEIELNATGKLTPDDLNSDYMSTDENGSRMAAYLIKKHKPNLLTLHLYCVDHAAHGEGRYGEHVSAAVATADRAIGNILEAIEKAGIQDSTAIIITGDHGFVDIHTSIAPNVWLAGKGLTGSSGTSWKAKFHTSGAAAFLMLKNKDDRKTLSQVRALLESLPESQKKLFRVVERAELDKIGADPAAVLALAPVKGIAMSSAAEGEPIRPAKGGTHGFFPDFDEIQTGFIGSGAGFNKGVVLPVMGLEDIAPVVAKLLGLPFKAIDGVLYPGLLTREPKSAL